MKYFVKFMLVWLLFLNSLYSKDIVGSIDGSLGVNNGRLSYSVPIKVPEDNFGLSPDLSITYTQGGSNGIVGLGFKLNGISVISRCANSKDIDNKSGGLSFNENSKYCLNGQRLVKISDDEYRLYDSMQVKIKRVGSIENPDYWVVYDSKGYIKTYGATDNSKLSVSKGTLVWKITSVKDRLNHKISYKYKKEDNDILIDEISYLHYKIKFNYKEREDSKEEYLFGIKRLHKYIIDSIDILVNDNLFYSYKLNYFDIDNSQNYTKYTKLKSITYCNSEGECLKPLKFNYAYKDIPNEVYTDNLINDQKLLNYIVADVDNDGYNDICYYNGNLMCSTNKGDGTFNNAKVWTTALNTSDRKLKNKYASTLTLVDLNGDSYPDYCVAKEDGLYCGINSKNKSFINNKYITKDFTIKTPYRFIDINKDNRVDICKIDENSAKCLLNDGNGNFGNLVTLQTPKFDFWLKLNNVDTKVPRPEFIDINKDGNLDICGFKSNTKDYYCSLGEGYDNNNLPIFGNMKIWGRNFAYGDDIKKPKKPKWYLVKIDENGNFHYNDLKEYEKKLEDYNQNKYKTEVFTRTFKFVDLNGDNLPDICYRNKNKYQCRINTGKGLKNATTWIDLPSDKWLMYIKKEKNEPDHNWIVRSQDNSINLIDLTGDGLPDFTAIVDDNLIVRENLGNRFGDRVDLERIVPANDIIESRKKLSQKFLFFFSLSTTFHNVLASLAYGPVKPVADTDNKNNKEMCYRSETGLSCIKIEHQPLALLQSITNSFGLKTEIEYKHILSDGIYIKENNAKYPFVDKPINMYLVSNVKTDNGIDGFNEIKYKYKGNKFNVNKGNLGFSEIIKIDKAKHIKTVTKFYRDNYDLNGKVKEVLTYANNVLISKSRYEYKVIKTQNPPSKRVLLTKHILDTYDLNGKWLSTKIIKNNQFNSFDQLTDTTESLTDSTGLNYSVITQTEYKNDTENWIIGKPINVIVTHTLNNQSVSKQTTFEYNDNGQLIKEIIEPSSDNAITTEYIYSSDNSKKTTKVITKDGVRESYTYYDEYGRVIKKENALHQFETIEYDDFCSLPKKETSINGLTTQYKYDYLCRKIEEELPNGNRINIFYDWSDKVDFGVDYQNVGFGLNYKPTYMVTTRTSTGKWSRVYYDAFGKKLREVTQGTTNKDGDIKKIYIDYVYNKKGELIAKTIPYFEGYFAGDNTNWIRFKRDILGRVIEQINPSSRGDIVTKISYDGFKVTSISPKGFTKTTYTNALEQKIKVVENDGSTIEYFYDPNGNIIKTIANNKVITFKYDKFNRKIYMNDPSLGEWHYYYNAFGELIKQTDAKGVSTTIKYDKLGRVIKKQIGNTITTFTYDTAQNGIGKIASSSNGLVTKYYKYDNLGRLVKVTQDIDDLEFNTEYKYNQDGQLIQKIMPSGLNLYYDYETNGALKSIAIPKKDIWDYDYISLEDKLKKTFEYINELQGKVANAEDKIKELNKDYTKYLQLARYYEANSKKYKKELDALNRLKQNILRQRNRYQSIANSYRSKARYYYRRFGRMVFTYVRAVGSRYYYKNSRCTHHNWKGRCTRRRTVYAYVPKWIIDRQAKSRYCAYSWKHTHCWWGPKKYIIVSDEYNKIADYYQYYANKFEVNRKRKLNNVNSKINYNNKKYNEFSKLAQEAQQIAKEKAKEAREESDFLSKLERELENQVKASKAIQQALDQRTQDNTKVYIWIATSRNAKGQIEGELYGNGLLTTRYYDVSGTIDRIKTGAGKYLIRDLHYTYDERNNVLSKYDPIHHVTENYEYDNMDRIISWSYIRDGLTPKTINRLYQYDINGNIIFKTGVGEMAYNSKNQLISTSLSNDFKYDANGNMISGNFKHYSYTPFNKIARVDYNQRDYQEFFYDESNNLVKKTQSNGKTTYYVGDGYEYIIEQDGLKQKEIMRHHIKVDGKVVAIHEKTLIDGQKQVDKTAYIHRDALDSVDMVTDNKGRVVVRNEYTPYGENIKDLPDSKNFTKLFKQEDLLGFTGHMQIPEANLINMKARIYDPVIARFTSPDTMIPHPDMIQAYNRYVYVYGNPLKYNDPSGHFIGFIFGAIIYAIASTSDDSFFKAIGQVIGSALMFGGVNFGLEGMAETLAEGAFAGFTRSFISSGGDLGAAIQGAVFAGVSATFTSVVAESFGHEFSVKSVMAQGITHGIIRMASGGKFINGFLSAVASKTSSAILKQTPLLKRDNLGNLSYTNKISALAVNMLIGGIVSKASGGSFERGAVTAGVVFLFNETKKEAEKKAQELQAKGINVMAAQQIKGDPNSWHVVDVNTALIWKTQGSSLDRAKAADGASKIFTIFTISKNPYIKATAEAGAFVCDLDKYMLYKEAGVKFPVDEFLIDTTTEIIPAATPKQNAVIDISIDVLYDYLKDLDY